MIGRTRISSGDWPRLPAMLEKPPPAGRTMPCRRSCTLEMLFLGAEEESLGRAGPKIDPVVESLSSSPASGLRIESVIFRTQPDPANSL